MTKRYLRRSLLLFAVCLTLLTVYAVRGDLADWYLAKFTPWTVSGTVTDITNGSPLDLAEIHVDGLRTYSVYNGTFRLENVRRLGEVLVVSPDLYEDYPLPLNCQTSVFRLKAGRAAVCNLALYPTFENVASRVEISLAMVSAESDTELQNRNGALWDLIEPESRRTFGTRPAFIELMVIHDLILRKLKQQEIAFKTGMDQVRKLATWTDPLTGLTYREVTEVPVRRTDASGKTVTVLDRFVRVDGIWRYIPDFRPGGIRAFADIYGWVLKLKD